MAVCRKRSTTKVPAALSISYLIGSPPIGTSMMTLTSSGGLWPIAMASRRMIGLQGCGMARRDGTGDHAGHDGRSEEHTSELQSLRHLVCRLLLEKKKEKE